MNLNQDENRTDALLWESLKAGNVSVFESIFKTNYGFLFNYCLRFHDDEDEIKDCIQILFLTIWERREFLGTTTSIRNYLLASLRRLVLKRMRDQNGRMGIDLDTFNLQTELSVEAQLIQDQSIKENLILLQQSIEKLPERQKEALYLKYFGNQSFAEIAAVMNITTRAVYKLIYKALDTLNDELRFTYRFE
ncbi:RNA polymerase sigma factor [Arundinibacter roseus]|uniref:Sigma-70 family RNA polymerase sigma factor n=1 Tax=Arundinibacter roseus TaxID=2070510 RepID=A0A4R4KFD4_9BACT|nr:sigma-70 family RNA polymerase sigma factor [Arundinibacter roseus]TDB65331.1 sigma-70 family RNA polymerase sigma factor [Arundinibacter roseus]